jgi:hypothetical protein
MSNLNNDEESSFDPTQIKRQKLDQNETEIADSKCDAFIQWCKIMKIFIDFEKVN